MNKEIQNISVDVLKVHPRNNEFFDGISGEEYERFKNSIKNEGILSPIIVAPDMTIISGHQRAKAAKDNNITLVPIVIREDLIDENLKLKALIAANFGRTKNNDTKQRKAISEYVELCGYKHGGSRCQNGTLKIPLEDIAKELGTSKRNLQRALSIERNLTDSMKELLDTGAIAKTLASDIISSLSEYEQEELFSKLDAHKKYTQKQIQQYIDKIKILEEREPQIIDKTDYTSIAKLEKEIEKLKYQKSILETKVRLNQEDADKFNKLKSDIEFLTKQKNDLSRQIDSATELAGLIVRLQKLLENELAPIKFKRCMETLDSSEVCMENLLDIVNQIDKWSDEMKDIMMKNRNIVADVQ